MLIINRFIADAEYITAAAAAAADSTVYLTSVNEQPVIVFTDNRLLL